MRYPLLCANPTCRPIDPNTGQRKTPRRTHGQAWFCPTCIDRMANQLRDIANAWDDLEANLATTSTGGEKGRTRNGQITGDLGLNEHAVDAQRAGAEIVWFLTRAVLATGGTIRPLSTLTIPTLAEWIADWQMARLMGHLGELSAKATLRDLAEARRLVRSAAYPSGGRRVRTGLPCSNIPPCPGTMFAWVSPLMTSVPDLVCDVDQTHRLDPATWQRVGWKRAHAALDPEASGRLARMMLP